MERFDWVIVGAGSAGAVLAARLSEDPDHSVLLLEAGEDHVSAATPPGVASLNLFRALETPGRVWPNVVAARAEGQPPAPYPRGLGVGGSSAVNAMAQLRGTPQDYDRWERELGCDGWGWDEMLAAFIAVEDDSDYGGDGWHGRGGPLPLTRFPLEDAAPFAKALATAMADLGYGFCDDYHAPDATGVSRSVLSVRDGRRVSTNDAYLEPARSRGNLSIRGNVVVDSVLVEDGRAIGVRTATGEEVYGHQVVLSAGAIHSPAILLRSGIGPETGRPVGANLLDHPMFSFVLTLKEAARATSTDAPVGISLLRYSSGLAGAGPNDMQIGSFTPLGASTEACAMGAVFGAVMRVFSRGELRLRSADPADDPIVEFRMLTDHRDVVRMRDATHRILELVRHPAVASIAEHVAAGTVDADTLTSDETIDACVMTGVTDYSHAAGTCRMGAPDDPGAVVDPTCRLIGVDRLWVCDASVLPDLPSANPHLTVVAMAERAARWMPRRPAPTPSRTN